LASDQRGVPITAPLGKKGGWSNGRSRVHALERGGGGNYCLIYKKEVDRHICKNGEHTASKRKSGVRTWGKKEAVTDL